MNEYIEVGDVPEWLVEGRTILAMKDLTKHTEVGNYRPITCFNLIWNLLTGIMNNETYDHLEENGLLAGEQKGPSRHGCISDASLRRLIQRLRDISKSADLQISEMSPRRLIKDVSSETSLRYLRFSQRRL